MNINVTVIPNFYIEKVPLSKHISVKDMHSFILYLINNP